jgi:hypothetical protein
MNNARELWTKALLWGGFAAGCSVGNGPDFTVTVGLCVVAMGIALVYAARANAAERRR